MQILSDKKVYSGQIFRIHKTWLRDSGGLRLLRETVKHPVAVAIIPALSKTQTISVR